MSSPLGSCHTTNLYCYRVSESTLIWIAIWRRNLYGAFVVIIHNHDSLLSRCGQQMMMNGPVTSRTVHQHHQFLLPYLISHRIWNIVHWSSLWCVRQSLWQSWEKNKRSVTVCYQWWSHVSALHNLKGHWRLHMRQGWSILPFEDPALQYIPSELIYLHCCKQWPSICLLTAWKVRTMTSSQWQKILARDQETSYLSLKLLFAHFLDLWVACDRVDGMMDSIIFENSLQHCYCPFR